MVLWIETGEMPFAGEACLAFLRADIAGAGQRRQSAHQPGETTHPVPQAVPRVGEAQNSSMPPVAPSRNPTGIGVRKRGSPMPISIQARISRIHFGICMSRQNWFIQYPNSEVYITERACQSVPMGNMFEYDED